MEFKNGDILSWTYNIQRGNKKYTKITKEGVIKYISKAGMVKILLSESNSDNRIVYYPKDDLFMDIFERNYDED